MPEISIRLYSTRSGQIVRNPLHIPDYYSPVNVNESYLTFILYIILPTTFLNVIMITLIRGIRYQLPSNDQTIILSLSE